MKDIFEKEMDGEIISPNDSEYYKIKSILTNVRKQIHGLNDVYHTEGEIHEIMSEIIGKNVDDSLHLITPFYTDFGKKY